MMSPIDVSVVPALHGEGGYPVRTSTWGGVIMPSNIPIRMRSPRRQRCSTRFCEALSFNR
jgi:hypothetical protein